MKKLSLFILFIFITCGGAESQSNVVQDSSDDTIQDTTTTTIQDTTTTSIQDTTTTSIQDTTTTTIVKNKCDDCEYVSISELISNLNNIPKFAWNDYQRISLSLIHI